MRRSSLLAVAAGTILLVGCADPVQPDVTLDSPLTYVANAGDAPYEACWGQATKVFAQMGAMGQHASEQPTPRVGLANLARVLYDAGIIPEPTLQALGVFVASELGLSVDACLSS